MTLKELMEVYDDIVVLVDIDDREITDHQCFDYAQCVIKHLDNEVCEITIIGSGGYDGLRVRLDCNYE